MARKPAPEPLRPATSTEAKPMADNNHSRGHPTEEHIRAAAGTDQNLDQEVAVQPIGPSGGADALTEDSDGVNLQDETGPRGRVLTLSIGAANVRERDRTDQINNAGTTTYEEVLPANASDDEVALAKQRLLDRAGPR